MRASQFLRVLLGAFVLLSLLAISQSEARVGGGHSYSSGRSSFSSSSSSGSRSSYSSGRSSSYSRSDFGDGNTSSGSSIDGTTLMLIIGALLVFPAIMGIGTMLADRQSQRFNMSTATMAVGAIPQVSLGVLRGLDLNFSEVVFTDFLFRLVSQAYRADSDTFEELAPYLSKKTVKHLAALNDSSGEPLNVVIGSIRIEDLEVPPPSSLRKSVVRVRVSIELNVSSPKGNLYLKERWSLSRLAHVQSKEPAAALILKCPNCAAPFESSNGRRCETCRETVDRGDFDWYVTDVQGIESKAQAHGLTGYVPEVGTDWKTIIASNLDRELESLRTQDPKFSEEKLLSRLRFIFDELNASWNSGTLEDSRGLVSSGLYSSLEYGLQSYRDAGLKNTLADPEMTDTTIAKVTRGKFYEAITLRLWAKGRDYTVDADEKVVGGRKNEERLYSEYWTLICGQGVHGKASDKKICPNCGADLKVSMSGHCDFCKVHVTSGEFDWVLSKIEQDESYSG